MASRDGVLFDQKTVTYLDKFVTIVLSAEPTVGESKETSATFTGTVIDKQTSAAITDYQVTFVSDGLKPEISTDNAAKFQLKNITLNKTISVTVKASGYLDKTFQFKAVPFKPEVQKTIEMESGRNYRCCSRKKHR